MTPVNAHIRNATEADVPDLIQLIKELAIFEKQPDAVKITLDEMLREGFGPNPLFTCFVAEVNNEVVGMALVYFRFSTWKGRTVHLEDLIVKQSFRGLGIGSKLYQKVMQHAKTQGVKRVEWVVLDWNKDAISFYEKSGATLLKDWYLVQLDENGISKIAEQ